MKQRSRHLKKKLLNCSILWNQHNDQVPIGLLAQLVEHCIAEVMGSNPVQIWIFFRPYFQYFQTVFITAKVALIFTSLSAVHIHDFRIFTVIYSYNCNLNRSAEHQVKALPDIHAILHSIPGKILLKDLYREGWTEYKKYQLILTKILTVLKHLVKFIDFIPSYGKFYTA